MLNITVTLRFILFYNNNSIVVNNTTALPPSQTHGIQTHVFQNFLVKIKGKLFLNVGIDKCCIKKWFPTFNCQLCQYSGGSTHAITVSCYSISKNYG